MVIFFVKGTGWPLRKITDFCRVWDGHVQGRLWGPSEDGLLVYVFVIYMYICICYIYICMYTCIYINIYIYTCVCINNIYIYTCVYIYIYLYKPTC